LETQGKSRKQLDFAAAAADDVVCAPSQQQQQQPTAQALRRSDSTQTDPWLPPDAAAAASTSGKRPAAQAKRVVDVRASDDDDDDLIVTSAPGKTTRPTPARGKRTLRKKRVVIADSEDDDSQPRVAKAPAQAAAAASGRESKAVATSTSAKRAAAVVETGAPVASKLAPRAKQPSQGATAANSLADVVAGGGGGTGGNDAAAAKDEPSDPFRTPDAHTTGAKDESPQGQRVRGSAADDVAGKQPAVVNTVARPRAARAAANDDDRPVKKDATTTRAFPSSSEATRTGKGRLAKVRRLDFGDDGDDGDDAAASFVHEDDAMDVAYERSDDVRFAFGAVRQDGLTVHAGRERRQGAPRRRHPRMRAIDTVRSFLLTRTTRV